MVRNNIRNTKRSLIRGINKFSSSYIYKIVAASFLAQKLMSNLSMQFASAIGAQVQTRQIQLSNSAISATGVNYTVSFYPTAVTAVGGITIDFCANDPIIGDTCTAPASPFTVGASPTFTGPTGIGVGGTWGATSNGAHNTFYLTNATAQAPTGT